MADSDVVTASELASYVYCPEQWRLEYGLGQKSENTKALEQGTRYHERTARAEVTSSKLLSIGRLLFLVGGLLLLGVILYLMTG
jgi:CRISPR/Cas system-associated exonuclease Cas4 (RecB family)